MARHGSPLRTYSAAMRCMVYNVAGRRFLGDLVGRVSPGELARELHVTTAAISAWVTGRARPDVETMFALQDRWGIPARSWIQPMSNQMPIDETRSIFEGQGADAAQ